MCEEGVLLGKRFLSCNNLQGRGRPGELPSPSTWAWRAVGQLVAERALRSGPRLSGWDPCWPGAGGVAGEPLPHSGGVLQGHASDPEGVLPTGRAVWKRERSGARASRSAPAPPRASPGPAPAFVSRGTFTDGGAGAAPGPQPSRSPPPPRAPRPPPAPRDEPSLVTLGAHSGRTWGRGE